MTFKKLTSTVLSITCIAALLTGCGSSNSKSSDTNTIRMATMTTGFTVAMHTANTTGIYSDLGLNVEEQYFDNGPSINEAIASGDIDIAGVGAMPGVTGAIANNTKIVAWMSDDESSVQIYARNGSDLVSAGKGNIPEYPNIYGTAETWKGKNIVCAKGTSSHYTLLATLGAIGLTESDINLINMEGSAGAAAFAAGTGDIFVGFDPQWADCFQNKDKYTCVSTCADTDKKLKTVLIATNDFCENRSEELVKLIQGMLKVEASFAADQNKYNDAMYEWQNTYGECSKELAEYSASLKPFLSVEDQKAMFTDDKGNGSLHNTLFDIADFMIDNKIIESGDKQKLTDNSFVNPSFLNEASNRLKNE